MAVQSLKSWVAGAWVQGRGKPTALINPTTEETLAEASSEGVDMKAAVAFARTKGLPALQALTFKQRGAALLAASQLLHAHRDELLDLSTASGGNTRGDAKFDVDGGTSTLAFYAKLGDALGDAKLLVDGEGVQLARSPKFHGEHVLVSRKGVAVHVNAFNFPAWGLLEKAAVALLAGVPVIAKPGTSTASLAHRIVELLVQGSALPEGALQLIVGSAGDLLDHLGPQDALAFTGSSITAATLRRHDAFVKRGARINVEADSLNAAVLGRDVEPGSDTFEQFVREVTVDLTQKAGQKCTAIRRIVVPRERLDAVREALVESLRAVKMGDPAQKEVKMGPLATAGQLKDVTAGVERLRSAGKLLTGGDRGSPIGATKGYFLAPTLIEFEDAFKAAAVHEHEVFGPVGSILPYSGDPADVGPIIGLGEGGLVSSIYTDDQQVALEAAVGMAPYLGRLNIGSAKVADSSLGPGAVLPQLIHGGPGRAGGGEELGGVRGVAFYMQRTAVQGYKPLLEKLVATGKKA